MAINRTVFSPKVPRWLLIGPCAQISSEEIQLFCSFFHRRTVGSSTRLMWVRPRSFWVGTLWAWLPSSLGPGQLPSSCSQYKPNSKCSGSSTNTNSKVLGKTNSYVSILTPNRRNYFNRNLE